MAAAVLGDSVCAKGMIHHSKETSIARDELYKTLSFTGNSLLGTVQKAVKAFELKLDETEA